MNNGVDMEKSKIKYFKNNKFDKEFNLNLNETFLKYIEEMKLILEKETKTKINKLSFLKIIKLDQSYYSRLKNNLVFITFDRIFIIYFQFLEYTEIISPKKSIKIFKKFFENIIKI